jgi:hypothetical protein
MTPIFVAPDPATVFASISPWSVALFNELLLIALVVVGLLVGGAILAYLIGGIKGGIARVVGSGKRRGGGRRGRR